MVLDIVFNLHALRHGMFSKAILQKAYTDLILKYVDRYKPFKYNIKYSNKYNLEW